MTMTESLASAQDTPPNLTELTIGSEMAIYRDYTGILGVLHTGSKPCDETLERACVLLAAITYLGDQDIQTTLSDFAKFRGTVELGLSRSETIKELHGLAGSFLDSEVAKTYQLGSEKLKARRSQAFTHIANLTQALTRSRITEELLRPSSDMINTFGRHNRSRSMHESLKLAASVVASHAQK